MSYQKIEEWHRFIGSKYENITKEFKQTNKQEELGHQPRTLSWISLFKEINHQHMSEKKIN